MTTTQAPLHKFTLDDYKTDLESLDAIRAGTKSGITWEDADKPVLNV